MKNITQINEIVYRFENQRFYGEKVGVYLINLSSRVLLFDIPEYSKDIETSLLSFNKPIECILSHGSCGISDGEKWQKQIGLKIYLHKLDENHNWLRIKPDILFDSVSSLNFGENIEVIHTPGHSNGSICVFEKSTKTLFVGDTLGGTKSGEVRDFINEDRRDDIPERLRSCKKLLDYDFKSILPFHYEMILTEAKETLEKYIYSNIK